MCPFSKRLHVMSYCLLLVIVLAVQGNARIRVVPSEYSSIQQAISSSVKSDTVLIEDGRYNERFWIIDKSITLASRFLIDGNLSHCSGTTIDLDTLTLVPGENNAVLLIQGQAANDSRIVGLTMKNGRGHSYGGGAVFLNYARATFEHCNFEDNRSLSYGGAVYSRGGTAIPSRFLSCTFRANYAPISGGAIHCAVVELDSCIFQDNGRLGVGNYCRMGGALWASFLYGASTISNCSFLRNSAGAGGAIMLVGLNTNQYSTRVEHSLFESNQALQGSSLVCESGTNLRVSNCVFRNNEGPIVIESQSTSIVRHNLFESNYSEFGQVLSIGNQSDDDSVVIEANRFIGNSSTSQSALLIPMIRISGRSAIRFEGNSLVGNNVGGEILMGVNNGRNADSLMTFALNLFAYNACDSLLVIESYWELQGGEFKIQCCDFYGNSNGNWLGWYSNQLTANYNLELDPLFCDLNDPGLGVYASSPCIADNNDCQVPIGATLLGCEIECGDIDASGMIDIADIVFLLNFLFAQGTGPMDGSKGDVNCSQLTNISDIVYLVNYVFVNGPQPCATCGDQ